MGTNKAAFVILNKRALQTAEMFYNRLSISDLGDL